MLNVPLYSKRLGFAARLEYYLTLVILVKGYEIY